MMKIRGELVSIGIEPQILLTDFSSATGIYQNRHQNILREKSAPFRSIKLLIIKLTYQDEWQTI